MEQAHFIYGTRFHGRDTTGSSHGDHNGQHKQLIVTESVNH